VKFAPTGIDSRRLWIRPWLRFTLRRQISGLVDISCAWRWPNSCPKQPLTSVVPSIVKGDPALQKLLIAAALLAAGFYVYDEYSGPGAGISLSSARSGSASGFAGARNSVIGGITGAATGASN
jgi:hypothetical protein